VPENAFIADQTIGELRIGEKTGAMILAMRHREGRFDTTPSADDRIGAGDTLIVLGTREQVARIDQLMRGEEIQDDS
jgi:K+/H+ antiporter YhaU regulatory subunit KhtT